MRIPVLVLGLVTLSVVACGDAESVAVPGDRVSDSAYVAVMGDLLRLDQARRSRPVPPWPGPSVGRLSSDTAWKSLRREESLKVVRVDSAARQAVLVQHGVTEAQLEATAVALVGDTKRGRVLWDSITKRAAQQPPSPTAPAPPAPAPTPAATVPPPTS